MPILIDLSIGTDTKQIDKLRDSFKEMRSALQHAASLMSGIARDAKSASRDTRNMGSGSGGSGGTGPSSSRVTAPPRQRFVAGPHQKLLALQEQESRLSMITDPARRAAVAQDINRSKFLAGRSITLQNRRDKDPSALTRPGLLELFETLNSKIGGLGGRGGGVMKSVLKAFGGGGGAAGAAGAAGGAGAGAAASGLAAAAGPIAIAAVAIVASFKLAEVAVKRFANTGFAAGQAHAIAGAGAGETIGIGRFFGGSGAQMARSFSGSIGGGGLAGVGAARAGIAPVPREFSAESDAARFMKFVNFITAVPEKQARQVAKFTGQEELLQLRDLSPQTLQDLTAAMGEMMSPENRRAAAEFKASMVQLSFAFDKLATLSKPAVDLITNFVNKWVEGVEVILGQGLRDGRSISDMETDSRRAWIEASNIHTRAMKKHGEVLGGGGRADGFLPAGAVDNLVLGGQGALNKESFGLL